MFITSDNPFDSYLGAVERYINDQEEIPFTLQDAIELAEEYNFNEYFWDDAKAIILEYFPELEQEETK